MCLILAAWRCHPDYPLVVAANRDEFFARPTAPAAFWPETPQVLAGKDLQAGGTWMGITRRGRFAALTNYRDPSRQRAEARSRGALVADFLRAGASVEDYLGAVASDDAAYNGYNLLVATDGKLGWHSNIDGATSLLPPGIYGVSNHLLDTPWPKLAAAKSALAAALNTLPDDDALFRLLRDDTIHPDDALPRTGVSLEWERLLSAAFVKAPGYGTRSSTVLMVDRTGRTVFDEITWRQDGNTESRRRFTYPTMSTGV